MGVVRDVLQDVLHGGLALLATVVGLYCIGVALGFPFGGTDDGPFVALQVTVGVTLACVALAIAAGVSGTAFGLVAAGWLGMVIGRCPHDYGPNDGNAVRAAAGVVFALLSAVAGWWTWQGAIDSGEYFRLGAGLLIAAGGGMIGIAILVPRVYFACTPGDPEAAPSAEPRHKTKDKKKPKRNSNGEYQERLPTLYEQANEQVQMLAFLAALGLGLATCTTRFAAKGDGEPEVWLPLGDAVTICVDSDRHDDACLDQARLKFERDDGRWVRVRYMADCPVTRIEASDDLPVGVLDNDTRWKLGIPTDGNRRVWSYRYFVFDTKPGVIYSVVAEAGAESCAIGARYTLEPTVMEDVP